MKQGLLKYTVLFIFLITSCETEEDFNVSNLNHNHIMILGHGGMGDLYKYPNNSLEAIIPVIGIGADGCEVDVQLSKDSVLILYHDEKLDSRTNYNGFISDYSWYELQNCIYSTLMGEVHLISVDELFNSLDGLNDLYFSFDCKLQNDLYYEENYRACFLRAIKRTTENYNIEENIFIEGDLDFQLMAQSFGVKSKGVLIGSTVDKAVEHNIFAIGTTLNTSAEEINYAHEKGIYVMMWGAKTDIGNKQAIRLNPDFLQTDKPIPILMLFNRFNYDYRIP